MIFRQLFDRDTCTYTYLLGDQWSREAVLIDPVRELVARDLALLDELGTKLVYVLETHVHADHITGAAVLRAKTGARVVYRKRTGVEGADLLVEDGDAIRWGLQAIEVRATPGHTDGCTTFVSANQRAAFTGDALFVRGCGRTDFQGGDARTLFRSVRDKIFSLPDDALVYPAHDYQGRTRSTVREERLYNPRLGGGRTEDQFVEIMEALDLAYPRKIDVAVPANLRCGRLEGDAVQEAATAEGSWPVNRTPIGAPNLPAIWVAEHRDEARLVDCRTPEEWTGPEGAIAGAEQVPMSRLEHAASGWNTDEALVIYCRSGGRSDRAALELEQRGFKRVASMTGGILKWTALGLPLAGGEQG